MKKNNYPFDRRDRSASSGDERSMVQTGTPAVSETITMKTTQVRTLTTTAK
jgi:hypothetical protein